MSTAVQNRNLLDQLTTAATAPQPLPAVLAPATDNVPTSVPPLPALGDQDAASRGSTANLESLAASPEQTAANVGATKQTEQNEVAADKQANPSFLDKLKRFAGGAVGINSPDSSSQAKYGNALTRILGGIGTAGELAIGTPAQKQIAIEQEKIPLQMQQMHNEALYRQGMLGIGKQNADTKGTVAATGAKTEEDKYAAGDAAMGLPPGTSRMTAEAAQKNADVHQQLEKIKEAQMNGQTYVTPEAAHAVGRDDLAGKSLGALAYTQQVTNPLTNQLKAAGGTGKADLGADGVWTYNPLLGRVTRLGDSPAVLANQRYMNRPVQAIDPTDNTLKWMSGTQAVSQGAAPGAQGAQIMSKQAQFKDIYSGLGNMRQAVAEIGKEPLDAGTISKLTLATRETDPTVAHQLIDTVLGTQNLTPAQQDFVIAVQQLNERALSLRNLAGMGNGSDQVRAAIRATLPSAKSGDSQMMLKQLDSVTNLVDNLYTGVPKINTGPKTPITAPPSHSGASPANNGTNPPKQSFAAWKQSQNGGQ